MPDHTPRTKLDIDWARTLAGAMAAMSSAVLLSTLGAAGTLIGAAIGSLAATIGTALYAQGLVRSKERVAQAQLASRSKIGLAKAEVRRARRDPTSGAEAESHLANAEERLDEAESELTTDGDIDGGEPSVGSAAVVGLGWRGRLALMPWKRVVLSAAAAFVVTLIAIAVFEYIAGRSVSSYTGGSGRDRDSTFTGDHSKPKPTPEPPTPTPTPDPTDSLTPTPTPSDSLTPSEEPTVEPTDSPGPTPTELPTLIPTPTP